MEKQENVGYRRLESKPRPPPRYGVHAIALPIQGITYLKLWWLEIKVSDNTERNFNLELRLLIIFRKNGEYLRKEWKNMSRISDVSLIPIVSVSVFCTVRHNRNRHS